MDLEVSTYMDDVDDSQLMATEAEPSLDANLFRGGPPETGPAAGGFTRKKQLIPSLMKRNKIALTRVVEQLLHYGPFNFLSELSSHGEGSIRSVKPIAARQRGLRGNWPTVFCADWINRRFSHLMLGNGLAAMGNGQGDDEISRGFLESVTEVYSSSIVRGLEVEDQFNHEWDGNPPFSHDDEPTLEESTNNKGKMCVEYRKLSKAISTFQDECLPVSCIQLKEDGKFYMVINKSKGTLVEITLGDTSKIVQGCTFFSWSMETDPCISDFETQICDKDVEAWCILIPDPTECQEGEVRGRYLITYDWNEMDVNGIVNAYQF
jgi:hypothetical protein